MTRPWHPLEEETLFAHPIFKVKRQRLAPGRDPDPAAPPVGDDSDRRVAILLDAPAWINVVPLLPDGRVVLVRQWRYGVAAETLEIPGGMVEPGEEPAAAAERELLEETGYRATRWTRLGELEPNPAFQTNRITTFLAEGLERVGEPEGDGDEEITLDTAPLAEIPALIAGGQIRHTLVVAAFYLLGLHQV
jgi:8-oxo-dGTP pyrophosphatase MutT (NUDIX family)